MNIVNYIADSGSRNSIIDPLRDSLVGELNNITLLGQAGWFRNHLSLTRCAP
ncbi:MAG: hypothetical protein IPF94_19405 [Betaproteobacteria bacterium]|nr:hypothetical protein [Betaproteobacteria bacterium]